MTNKKHSFEWWVANRNTPEGQAEFDRMKRLYAEDMAAETGPVRTVTRKEIVPGVYGRIAVFENDYSKSVLIRLADAGGEVDLNQDGHYFDAGQLTDAIETLTQIRDALKENE